MEIPGPKGAKPTIVNVDEEAAKVFFFRLYPPLSRMAVDEERYSLDTILAPE